MTETTLEATEAAVRKAEAAGIPLEEIDGSGDGGKITAADVDAEYEAREARDLDTAPDVDERAEDAGAEMDPRDHKKGCPARAERIEIYQARKPVRSEEGALIRHDMVPVAHCLDCGETVVLEVED